MQEAPGFWCHFQSLARAVVPMRGARSRQVPGSCGASSHRLPWTCGSTCVSLFACPHFEHLLQLARRAWNARPGPSPSSLIAVTGSIRSVGLWSSGDEQGPAQLDPPSCPWCAGFGRGGASSAASPCRLWCSGSNEEGSSF